MNRLSVYACWERARQEFPKDHERRKMRYVELLRDEGHIVPKDHPLASKTRNLPCGWPGLPEDAEKREGL